MPNPSGANSPTSYDQGAQTVPYGEKKQEQAKAKAVPLAGAEETGPVLNTAREAVDLALRQNRPAQPVAPAPQPDPVASLWAELAAQPGASPLVKEYAARAQGPA